MKCLLDYIISNKITMYIFALLLMIVAIIVFYKLGKNIGEAAYYLINK